MVDVTKLGNAEFRTQLEAAVKGLSDASDAFIGAVKEAHGNQSALMADAAKLGSQYDILQEMIALQQTLKVKAGESINLEKAKAALQAIAEKVSQEGHPLRDHVERMRPEIQAALKAKDYTAIGKTIKMLVGENGPPEGPIRDLVAKLQAPIEQTIEHGVKLTKLIENEGKLSPAKELILKRIAVAQLPKVKEHLANLEGLGMVVPEEARNQFAAFEAQLNQNPAAKKAAAAAATTAEASKAAEASASAASTSTAGHTSSGGNHSSAPATTVSSATSEGRKWYQWLTHEEEAGKALFSGKRTAISAGAAAAVAGGIYLLKRDKRDDSWQSRTGNTEGRSEQAAR